MASELDELIAMSDEDIDAEDLDAEARRHGSSLAQMVAETKMLVERLGKVRNAGIAAERERVRDALIAEMRGWDGGDAHDAIHGVAARLGIDLRQPAGKGEDNGK